MKNLFLFVNIICLYNILVAEDDIAQTKKNITVIGTGYVGLVAGACLADMNHKVICADVDEKKINKLKNGEIPIYEPGLKEIVDKNFKNKNLEFTTNIQESIKKSQVIYIAVGTPMDDNGNCDLRYVDSVMNIIKNSVNDYKVIVNKSTVPIGTALKMQNYFDANCPIKVDVVSNPEFLKEGSAVKDFFFPDRIILGSKSIEAIKIMKQVYSQFETLKVPVLVTDNATAETIKYASNSFLATKVTVINELSDLCEKTGANIAMVAKGMGLDDRIGPKFLNAGPGYGGSCFPKDILALLNTANQNNTKLSILACTHLSNEEHKRKIAKKFIDLLGENTQDKTVTILGLAFKANTDDVRYSPAISIIKNLIGKVAKIKAYDPQANDNMKALFGQIEYSQNIYDAINKTDGIIIVTEWPEFKDLDYKKVRALVNSNLIYDCRNILSKKHLTELGFDIHNIGNAEN